MRRGGPGAALLAATALLLAPRGASANSFEDVFGVGSRAKAMGGAGTALARDPSATWYNPANLALCPHNELSVGLSQVAYDLQVWGAGDDAPATEPLADRTAVTMGFCLLLPLDFAFGLYFSQGWQNPQHLNQASIDPRPIFALYGRRLESLALMVGPAYRLLDELAVGVALSILANSDLLVRTEVPLATPDAEVRSALQWRLYPTVAVHAGLAWTPVDSLSLGLAYRSALFHKLEAVAPTQVELGGVLVQLDLLLEAVSWYSPQQAAVGAAWEPSAGLTVAGDLTWYDWSAWPGPFVHPSPSTDSAVGRTLPYPPSEPPGFTDIVVPRLGLELDHDSVWAARVGYGYRPTPAPQPAGLANLLDGDMHTLALGGGYCHTVKEGYVLQVAASLSVGLLSDRHVDKGGSQPVLDTYDFGGTVLEAGLTLSAGYPR